ncbi:hypothetical protein JTB14_037275 [Gonioctena quinquepunctata]|nr:hypothetical protein JTB14_037275 [Gonioctena quinquepunctata]
MKKKRSIQLLRLMVISSISKKPLSPEGRVFKGPSENHEEEGLKNFAYLMSHICGTDEAHHDHNPQLFMKTAKKYNSTLNEEKCVFATDNIKIIGYSIERKQ